MLIQSNLQFKYNFGLDSFFCELNAMKKISLRLPGAGTIKLDMASSLIELSVGGGGHTKLSIISTFRPLANAEMTGGSVKIQIIIFFFLKIS